MLKGGDSKGRAELEEADRCLVCVLGRHLALAFLAASYPL